MRGMEQIFFSSYTETKTRKNVQLVSFLIVVELYYNNNCHNYNPYFQNNSDILYSNLVFMFIIISCCKVDGMTTSSAFPLARVRTRTYFRAQVRTALLYGRDTRLTQLLQCVFINIQETKMHRFTSFESDMNNNKLMCFCLYFIHVVKLFGQSYIRLHHIKK